jgi:hypothetical protein
VIVHSGDMHPHCRDAFNGFFFAAIFNQSRRAH